MSITVNGEAMPSLPVPLLVLALFLSVAGSATAQQPRARFDVDLFSQVPDPPGLPEGIAVNSRGEVFVGTNPGDFGPQGPNFGQPTKVFRYAADGTLKREYTVEGESIASALPAYGTQSAAFDGKDQLYLGDKVPPRVVRLDPESGEQRDYVAIPDVPPCSTTTNKRRCSDTAEDLRPSPNYLAFAPDGSLYVSDLQQAVVFRVPPGGGAAEVALTDRRLDSTNGPNGIQFLADGRTFVLNQTLSEQAPNTGRGQVFTGKIGDDGRSGPLRELHTFGPMEGVDGLAVAASGNIYVELFTVNQIAVLAPDGRELSRFGSSVPGPSQAVQFDNPASSAFVGRRLLITNQSVFAQNPATTSILDAFVDEPGLPLFRPVLRPAAGGGSGGAGAPVTTAAGRRPSLRVRVSPRRDLRSPRRFVTTGTLTPPPGVTRAIACSGRVSVQVKAGRSTISTRRVALRPACTFRSSVSFGVARRFGRRRALSVQVRFAGNRALDPRRAPAIPVRVR